MGGGGRWDPTDEVTLLPAYLPILPVLDHTSMAGHPCKNDRFDATASGLQTLFTEGAGIAGIVRQAG